MQVGEVMARNDFRIDGIEDIKRSMRALGKIPQKHVTSSSRKGMNVVLKSARASAPEDSGNLKRGMKLQGERSRAKAKKVYQVVFDRGYNHVFQKKNAAGKVVGYYPVSQEYGYFSKSGRYIPGFKFVHQSLSSNTGLVERTIVTEIKKKIDAEIAKARGGL